MSDDYSLYIQDVARLVLAMQALLDDTQHANHPDCEGGPCPVREARQAIARFDPEAALEGE